MIDAEQATEGTKNGENEEISPSNQEAKLPKVSGVCLLIIFCIDYGITIFHYTLKLKLIALK